MGAEDLFEGFDHTKYEAEVRERWGDEAVDAANRRYERLSKDEAAALQAEHESVSAELAAALGAGIAPGDPQTLDLVDRHYRYVSVFRDVGPEEYAGLGSMYVDDPRFRRTYDKHRAGLAEYLRDAIVIYVRDRM